MDLQTIIATYGYLAVFLGVIVEGELVMLTAGFLASRQLLQLDWVIIAALLGSIAIYQTLFFVGRTRGNRLLAAYPAWGARVAKVQRLLAAHHLWVVFGYRMLYGMRTVAPCALGMSGISQRRFFALDLIPAILWSVAFPWLGYVLGREVRPLLAQLDVYRAWGFAGLAAVLLLVLSLRLVLRRHRR